MDLFIETLTGTAFELRVSPFETIMSVKAKIQRLEGKLLNHKLRKDDLRLCVRDVTCKKVVIFVHR